MSWLLPLVNRVPIVPILTRTFATLASIRPAEAEILYTSFSAAFLSLWPLASRRVNAEVLFDCFGAALRTHHAFQASPEKHQVLKEIASTFRASLTTSSAKKKVNKFSDESLVKLPHSFVNFRYTYRLLNDICIIGSTISNLLAMMLLRSKRSSILDSKYCSILM